jgi:SAM-dependent methyltransferase
VARKRPAPTASPTADLLATPGDRTTPGRPSIRSILERLIAVGYGLTYDGVVHGFPPYEALVEEVAGLIARSAPASRPGDIRVLDVACGIGSVAARLARRGWTVVGCDAVEHLVVVARQHHRDSGLSLSFHHVDVARDPLPGDRPFDVLVSMHTLYWHSDPDALLAACYRALGPGGHAIFLTYERPARVGRIFAQVRRERGWSSAIRALRWLLPTALFDLLRGVRPRYLSRGQFDAALLGAGFDILERRQSFLAGISLVSWARKPGAEPSGQR